jgi:hypothetical protein
VTGPGVACLHKEAVHGQRSTPNVHPTTSVKSWLAGRGRHVVRGLTGAGASDKKNSTGAVYLYPGRGDHASQPSLPALAVWTPKGYVTQCDAPGAADPAEPDGQSWVLGSGLLGGGGYGGTPDTAYAGGRTYE